MGKVDADETGKTLKMAESRVHFEGFLMPTIVDDKELNQLLREKNMERAARLARLLKAVTEEKLTNVQRERLAEKAKEYIDTGDWPLCTYEPGVDPNVSAEDLARIEYTIKLRIEECKGNRKKIEAVHEKFAESVRKAVYAATGGAVTFYEAKDISYENQNRVALKFMEIIGHHENLMKLISDEKPIRMMYASSMYMPGMGRCFGEDNKIEFSTKWFDDLQNLGEVTVQQMSSGFWVKVASGEEWKHTITHETGHAVHNALAWRDSAPANAGEWEKRHEYFKNRSDLLKKYKSEICKLAKKHTPGMTVNAIKKTMSKYGQTNSAEFFAEAFTNAMGGSPDIIGLGMQDFLKSRGLL